MVPYFARNSCTPAQPEPIITGETLIAKLEDVILCDQVLFFLFVKDENVLPSA